VFRLFFLLVSAFGLASATPAPPPVEQLSYKVKARFPHDSTAYTQGLFVRDGHLFESTGREGQSELRKVRLSDGKVQKSVRLPPHLFGEGSVDWKDEIVSLTWRSGIGFRWKLNSLKQVSRFRYPGEGWGLTRNDHELIMSDGTPDLRFVDPTSFAEKRRVTVRFRGTPLSNLNELEWVKGSIYANIWQTDMIVRIDPSDGRVTGLLNLTSLSSQVEKPEYDAVLNGIAYDPKSGHLLVTGKLWPSLFALRVEGL
jgi:glutaminyl-peptide cyclotransferase